MVTATLTGRLISGVNLELYACGSYDSFKSNGKLAIASDSDFDLDSDSFMIVWTVTQGQHENWFKLSSKRKSRCQCSSKF